MTRESNGRDGIYIGLSGQTALIESLRVASAGPGGSIELRLGSPDGKLIGTCKVENTGGTQSWKSVTCDVSGATGVQDLVLKFTGGEAPLLNLDYWRFE